MTDPQLVAKKLAQIETAVDELRTLGHPDQIDTDLREQRFVLYTLQMGIQAALDVASHIVSDERMGEPRTNRELFTLLAQRSWISADLARTLHQVAGFRNVVVHGYDTIDLAIVRDVLAHRLDDLLQFVAAVRART